MAVRVELNGPPPWEVYEQLYEALERFGLYKVITSDDGITYHLPKGMYVGTVDYNNVVALREHLQIEIGAIWADAEIIVFRYDQASWYLKLNA